MAFINQKDFSELKENDVLIDGLGKKWKVVRENSNPPDEWPTVIFELNNKDEEITHNGKQLVDEEMAVIHDFLNEKACRVEKAA